MAAPPKQHAELHRKWSDWLEAIKNDLVSMHGNRAIWKRLVQILESNEEIPSRIFFRDWLTRLYLASQAMAVRRQTEVKDQVVSLGRLIDAVLRNPEVMTYDRYLNTCGPPENENTRLALSDTFAHLAKPGSKHVDPDLFAALLDSLSSMAERIITYANERVAHIDGTDETVSFTFGELDQAIDRLGEVLSEMHLLILCSSLEVEPYLPGWERSFTVPWISVQDLES